MSSEWSARRRGSTGPGSERAPDGGDLRGPGAFGGDTHEGRDWTRMEDDGARAGAASRDRTPAGAMTTALAALLALEAFIQEHLDCGELDSDGENAHVWMTCTCGAVITQKPNPPNPRLHAPPHRPLQL